MGKRYDGALRLLISKVLFSLIHLMKLMYYEINVLNSNMQISMSFRLGKGLGAQEDGETQNVKVKVKNDKQGIGANNDYSDTWLDHQDDFNSILAALNTCHSAPGSGTATPNNEVNSRDLGETGMNGLTKLSRAFLRGSM